MNKESNRMQLGFQDAVREYFAFVENEYGFKCVFSDVYIVKYESRKAYLKIYHEKLSYELNLEVGLISKDNKNRMNANIKEILEFSRTNEKTFYQASNRSGVYDTIEKFAIYMKEYAQDALNASLPYFSNINEFKMQERIYSLQVLKLETVESNAKAAWNNKDYETVIEEYSQVENQLNALQIKRLAYARKRVIED